MFPLRNKALNHNCTRLFIKQMDRQNQLLSGQEKREQRTAIVDQFDTPALPAIFV